MARIVIIGSALVVESTATIEEIKTLEKFAPKALQLFESDGKTIDYIVGSTTGKGSINKIGASFGSATGEKATITLDIPVGTKDPVAYAEEVIGVSIIKLNKIEAQFADALAEVSAQIEEVRSNITLA